MVVDNVNKIIADYETWKGNIAVLARLVARDRQDQIADFLAEKGLQELSDEVRVL